MWPFASKQDVRRELEASEQRILSHLATTREVAYLRQQLNDQQQTLKEIHTMLSHLSTVTPEGQKKHYRQDINDQVDQITGRVKILANTCNRHIDNCAKRLENVTALMNDEADKHNKGQLQVEALIIEMKSPDGGSAATN